MNIITLNLDEEFFLNDNNLNHVKVEIEKDERFLYVKYFHNHPYIVLNLFQHIQIQVSMLFD